MIEHLKKREILSAMRACSCGKLETQYHLSTGMAVARRSVVPQGLIALLGVRDASVTQEAQEVFAYLVF